ncbi:MAG: LPS-assembly protein LptD, partial [Gammaproteobacteria bacterium]
GYYGKRGASLEAEGRYLFAGGHHGEIIVDGLPDDDVFGDERYLLGWSHVFRPDENWRTEVNLQEASDQRYLEDFGSGLLETSSSHLHRYLSVERDTLRSALDIRLDDYQMMDRTVATAPYQVLPRISYYHGFRFPQQRMAADLNLDLASFNRNSRVEGWRLNAQPEVRWPFRYAWGGVEPKIKVDLTQYELENTVAGTESSPSRAIPMLRVDGDLVFEKALSLGDGAYTHTIEPRAMYLYVPRKNQSAMPVFDTNTLTPSYTGLFYDNRFAGGDRIGDTNQISLGVSSRLLNESVGRELLRADVGVAYYLEDRQEQLPGVAPQTANTSEYVARLRSEFARNWFTELEYAYDADLDDSLTSNYELGYRPGDGNTFTLQHRYLRDNTGHSLISGSLSLNPRWRLVAAYDYSHRLDKAIDVLAGLEYGTCCWGVRLVGRHYQTDTTGATDDAVLLELELKGLAGIGDSVRSTLADEIDGYTDVD